MAGKRAAKITISLVLELIERLQVAGIPAGAMPSADEAVDAVWPLAVRLAKVDRSGKAASKSAAEAQHEVLSALVAARVRAMGAEPWHFPPFDPEAWHVEVQPGAPTAADRDRATAPAAWCLN